MAAQRQEIANLLNTHGLRCIFAPTMLPAPTGIPMNQAAPHAELIASYRKLATEATKKADLVKAAAGKGPRTIATVTETAAKAARRRDVVAAKLAKLGVALPS